MAFSVTLKDNGFKVPTLLAKRPQVRWKAAGLQNQRTELQQLCNTLPATRLQGCFQARKLVERRCGSGATGCPGVPLKHTGIVCVIAWCTWNIFAWSVICSCEKKTCLTRRFHGWDDQRLSWLLAVTMLRPLKACRPVVGAPSNHRPDTVVGIIQPYPWHTYGSVVVQHSQVNDKLMLYEFIPYNWLKGTLITCTHAPSALRRTSALGCVCRTDCRTPGDRVQLSVHLESHDYSHCKFVGKQNCDLHAYECCAWHS